MSDRLTELRRQRALVQDHADWLDREIAACVAAMPGPPADASLPTTSVSPSSAPVPPLEAPPELIYTPDPAGTRQQVKRGCFLYFFIALALLSAALFTLLYVRYRDRPMLFMAKDEPAAGTAQSEVPVEK